MSRFRSIAPIVFITVMLGAFHASAAAVPSIATLRLGMPSASVLRGLQSAGLQLTAVISHPCLSDDLAQHRARVAMSGTGHCVQLISTKYGGGDLLIFLTEDLPRHPGTSIVSTIALNYPTDWRVVESVMREAGKPTVVDGSHPWVVAMWCFETRCTDMTQGVGNRSSGPALLVHRGAGLTLTDSRAAAMREDVLNHELETHHVVLSP